MTDIPRAKVALSAAVLIAAPLGSRASIDPGLQAAVETLYLHQPTISGDRVVFTAAGDLWIAAAAGGVAARLTSDPGTERNARFSPSGGLIAYTGDRTGSPEVYVIPADGGEPRRLTFDPYGASVLGWTADGGGVLVRSARANGEPKFRLHVVPMTGGAPRLLPVPSVNAAAAQADGRHIAYVPGSLERLWFGYRGGQAGDLWVVDLTTGQHRRLTEHEAVDTDPVWVGERLYFLSEREGYANVYRLDPRSGRATAVTRYSDHPVRRLDSDGQRLVFDQGGSITVLDVSTGRTSTPRFSFPPWHQPQAEELPLLPWLQTVRVIPDNSGVFLEARGQIVRVQLSDGRVRIIEATPGTRARHPEPSPDGRLIGFVSDASGEEQIWVAAAEGTGRARQLTHGDFGPLGRLRWSPNGEWIASADHELRLFLIDARSGAVREVDQGRVPETGSYSSINSSYRFSPDGRWLTYDQLEPNSRRTVYAYEIASGTRTAVTPPVLDAFSPAFDPDGRVLYFLADREYAPRRDIVSRLYSYGPRTRVSLVTLAAGTSWPLPDSGKAASASASQATQGLPPMHVDLAGISERVVDLALPTGDYTGLQAAVGRVLLSSGRALLGVDLVRQRIDTIHRSAPDYELTDDRRHVAVVDSGALSLVPLDGSAPRLPVLRLDSLRIRVDRRAEWQQIFHEASRVIPSFFYDSTMGGRDWSSLTEKYRGQLALAADRADVSRILSDLLSELGTSHARVAGGDLPPRGSQSGIGSLGIDVEPIPERDAYQIVRILRGDGFDLRARSPLLAPGINVRPGDVIVAVDDERVSAAEDFNRYLVNKGGKRVKVTIRRAGASDTEQLTTIEVEALRDESALRYADWVDQRRALVDRLSGGRLGYVHFPSMNTEAFRVLAERYYPTLQREGMVLDLRNNFGGSVAEVLLMQMATAPQLYHQPRYGAPWTRQTWSVAGGRMAALCNEWSGSNAEEFCLLFQRNRLGPVVGRRTEGGVIGSCCGHPLVDGGMIFVPNYAARIDREWVIEGAGVLPDVVVAYDPGALVSGRDPELERAVSLLIGHLDARRHE